MISETQIGFKKGARTSDHIFVLKSIINNAKVNRKHIFSCFIDFQKAFGCVWREGMFFKMITKGLSSKFVSIIKSMLVMYLVVLSIKINCQNISKCILL